MPIINAFNDVKRKPFPQPEGIGGFDDLRSIAALQVGAGNRAFKSDESGIWLGAHKWADAPFKVDMQGNLVATQATIGGSIVGANITLGGAADVNGVMSIKDASDNLIIKGDRFGHHYYDTSANELVKIDWVGFHAYDTDGHELVSVSASGWELKDTGGETTFAQVANGMVVKNNNLIAWYDTGNELASAIYMNDSNEFILANINGDISIEPSGEVLVYSSVTSVTSGFAALGDIVTTNGKMYSTGGYDPIIEINDKLYSTWSPEAPQYLVFYYGSGELKNGSYLVDLSRFEEPTEEWLFTKVAKDVSIFVTPLGDSYLYAEKRGDFSFEIKTSGADVPFSYFLVGKKVGYDTSSTRLGEQVISAEISDKNKEKLLAFARKEEPDMKRKKDLLMKKLKKKMIPKKKKKEN